MFVPMFKSPSGHRRHYAAAVHQQEGGSASPLSIEQQARRGKATRTSRLIEIELKGGDRVRIEGCADPALVVRIVSTLRRA